ncbi:gas vesicle protein [Streptomyces kronopolitis]|uniref:gas vesicle protein n=1 Tax=Streptomyces kronopolitis TaxID=1612435 RepID=UPI003558F953
MTPDPAPTNSGGLPGIPGVPRDHGITDLSEEESLAGRQVALIDLLDRLLNGGAVLTGDLVLSVADVDLVRINLRAVIHSITPDDPAPW